MLIDFNHYYQRPCRIKFRSGKEVFGVIWVDGETDLHYFASPSEYGHYLQAKAANDIVTCERLKTPINIEDVIRLDVMSNYQFDLVA